VAPWHETDETNGMRTKSVKISRSRVVTHFNHGGFFFESIILRLGVQNPMQHFQNSYKLLWDVCICVLTIPLSTPIALWPSLRNVYYNARVVRGYDTPRDLLVRKGNSSELESEHVRRSRGSLEVTTLCISFVVSTCARLDVTPGPVAAICLCSEHSW
jgi:hypothetical protein